MSDLAELVVPKRFRVVVEGPLEHEPAILEALKAAADERGCLVLARAERTAEQTATPDEIDPLAAEIMSWDQ